MSDLIDLTEKNLGDTPEQSPQADLSAIEPEQTPQQREVPKYELLQKQLSEASELVDDIILKQYLTSLSDLEVIPIDESLCSISDIRLFKITEMVYQNDEYSTYKFASVFNAVQNLNCGVYIIADSDGKKTTFYMGVRSFDTKRTTQSLKDTLQNALRGQFPGVKTEDLRDVPAQELLGSISEEGKNIASVSCIANNKDSDFKDNETFIQGLEKLALAMQGKKYTAIVLAKSTPQEQLALTRQAYETIYTQLSPFATMQLSYGSNEAISISDAFSKGTSTGTSHSVNHSRQEGKSYNKSVSWNKGTSTPDAKAVAVKTIGTTLLGVASIAAAPLTGGVSIAAAGAIMAAQTGLNLITPKTKSEGTATSETEGGSISETEGTADTLSQTDTENITNTRGKTFGTSDNMQLTMQNKTLIDTLERIDLQLKRIDECESLGMWECAAYFLSDSQATVEMAAGTYKAIMHGEKSGIETSAVNFWGRSTAYKLPMLRKYITNFVHPAFEYKSEHTYIPVTAASLVSGNELAIQMGLPRKSVCGFPVIEHADFGKEVVRYTSTKSENDFELGKIFGMGLATEMEARLSRDSLTMHTFVTGSTGSGKSNTVYEILDQLHTLYQTPFLVIEPAKGEYKNVFGKYQDVTVYGTNPKKFSGLLKLNPFRFPADIHILEHLDRLVEIFNVCWPMYAAMPAVLKEAMEKAYIASGWNMITSENPKGEIYPNFNDLLEQIESVFEESRYSADTKGDYVGALCTRVRSLTTGLNGMIFCQDDIIDSDLFDKSVIVDLSRIGSTETKSLIMGLLIMKLNEYRMTFGKMNSSLSHITVLEEAHNILKRTSTDQTSEGSNLLGKSVEMLANSIAEMRTYGEGFIIADQSPGLLDMSVIRNTNTKIILRLPDQSDRELVGLAAGLNKDQIQELSKLERGVAAVYQNDWVEPVLVQVNKCNIKEEAFYSSGCQDIVEPMALKRELLSFLIQGRVPERLDFDAERLDRNLDLLGLSSRNREFIEEQIAEYKDTGTLSLWKDENFHKLSRRVTDLLEVRKQVENSVLVSHSNDDLSEKLERLAKSIWYDASEAFVTALSHCMMKDMSLGQTETETRQLIYQRWTESVKERAARW